MVFELEEEEEDGDGANEFEFFLEEKRGRMFFFFFFWSGCDTWQILQQCVGRCLNSNNHKLFVGGKMKEVEETSAFWGL